MVYGEGVIYLEIYNQKTSTKYGLDNYVVYGKGREENLRADMKRRFDQKCLIRDMVYGEGVKLTQKYEWKTSGKCLNKEGVVS